MISVLETYDLATGRVTQVLRHEGRVEAPNWSPCGTWLLVNHLGALWRVLLDQPGMERIDTGAAQKCNNDHGFTKDGRLLLGSHHEGKGAQIYAVPMPGGVPETISTQPPSWWHGLSPDGLTMVYAAARDGSKVDIYTRALAGGAERRLTQSEGHSDGPEFSADGKGIYWNCDRGGMAQIWYMSAEGMDQRQLFADDRVNWFPHPSPCGRWLIYLSYPPGTEGHPYDLPVQLMLCTTEGRDHRILREITGGQGTMNVPCWAPDGGAFAYVRYEP